MPDPEQAADGRRQVPVVGIVGAGQLARMLCEAASVLGIDTVVMAEDAATTTVPAAGTVVEGGARQVDDLVALARRCTVVTFDHEHVDLAGLERAQANGGTVRPGPGTLAFTVDKAYMRTRLAGSGIPVPAFSVLPTDPPAAMAAVDRFGVEHGWPLILKTTTGGYDGKGVWPVDDRAAADAVCRRAAGDAVALLVEELVPIDRELAVLVARRPGGEVVTWPVVETVQIDGICREVVHPAGVERDLADAAERLGRAVAEATDATGVLAVELFAVGDRLLVNELAARPHNSGHWTMEGAVTSQFENHLRAVLDLPLGATDPVAGASVMVNVLGGGSTDPAAVLDQALCEPSAHVHLYGKAPRAGRKLGHVTTTGTDVETLRTMAWTAAARLGNPEPGRRQPVRTHPT